MTQTETIIATGITTIVVAASILTLSGDKALSTEPRLYAQIDEQGEVLQVIVISEELLATGKWGDPAGWVQTFEGEEYAQVGGKYDKNAKAFIKQKPYESWVLDEATLDWKALKDKPKDAEYYWDEASIKWVKYATSS